MDAQLLIWIVEHYTEAGETILDPMAGSGTTMLACILGRDVVLVELEEKFCKMMRDNWEQVKMRPQLGSAMGSCEIIQGDARQLEGLVDKIVTSPPYAQGIHPTGENSAEVEKIRPQDYVEHCQARLVDGYGKNPNNIGNLPYGEIDKCIFSPPYAETGVGDWQTGRAEFQAWVLNELAIKGYIEWQGKRYTESEWRAMNHGRIDGRTTKGVHKHPTEGYGETSGQVGNLPYGQIDKIVTSPVKRHKWHPVGYDLSECENCGIQAKSSRIKRGMGKCVSYEVDSIITSPPYEAAVSASTGGERDMSSARQREKRLRDKGYDPVKYQGGVGRNCEVDFQYSKSEGNIGNLKSQSYLEAMLQVYQQCYKVLKPQGLMILVTKNFIRNKQVIRLDEDTIKLCEQAGFNFIERHYRKLPSQSFWRVIYHNKFPDVEQILNEDILIFQKELLNG